MELNELTKKIIGCAVEVQKNLGQGLLESAYEKCLSYELTANGLKHEVQKELPIKYKSVKLDAGYRIDIIVENSVIIELKSVEKIQPIHQAQILTYMKLSGVKIGLLINFNVTRVTDGIKRFIL